MLARLWRNLCWLVIAPTAWLLRGLADSAHSTRGDLAVEDLRDERQKHQMTKGLLDVEKAQNALLAAKLGQYVAHVKAETDAQTARSVLATERPDRE